ncbi:hypothetical protein BS50DRAFT_413033 [Corynespora cassiicola Philippines]|uniref:Uncharacterized protein n=1 Tax=Corynespora cassiicola Philippines TaxID=1448308 RepID=A0A2T2NLW4_CORCC|nr:hypothetical protein BS50DRAFT_413033 [Corynespora cassiicola Philippines]
MGAAGLEARACVSDAIEIVALKDGGWWRLRLRLRLQQRLLVCEGMRLAPWMTLGSSPEGRVAVGRWAEKALVLQNMTIAGKIVVSVMGVSNAKDECVRGFRMPPSNVPNRETIIPSVLSKKAMCPEVSPKKASTQGVVQFLLPSNQTGPARWWRHVCISVQLPA